MIDANKLVELTQALNDAQREYVAATTVHDALDRSLNDASERCRKALAALQEAQAALSKEAHRTGPAANPWPFWR